MRLGKLKKLMSEDEFIVAKDTYGQEVFIDYLEKLDPEATGKIIHMRISDYYDEENNYTHENVLHVTVKK